MVQPRRTRPPSPAVSQEYHVAAPIGGINTVAPATALPEGDCLLAVNVIGAENGLRVRLGYGEWVTGITGSTSAQVRTIAPFTGSQLGTGRLFATSDTGIWDVSSSTAAPVRVATFPLALPNSGYGVSTVVVTQAGHFLLYTDEEDGLWLYSESGASWTRVTGGSGAGQINGVDPRTLCFVMLFKSRVWFVQKNTGDAWYLPAGQVTGTATRFPLGGLFRAGGSLVGLWDWTYDGGAGLDDSLVAISSGGDVLVYQGTDPSSSFALRGMWYVGPPPVGRRIASSTGGELLIVSRRGVVPMSKLVVGTVSSAELTTAKIANLINASMLSKANQLGWALVEQPADNSLLLLQPRSGSDTTTTQFVQSLVTGAWTLYNGLHMACAASWNASLYFGTPTGRVCIQRGYVDGTLLSSASAFTPVAWALLTAPTNLGSARLKRATLIRPLLVSNNTTPAVRVEARYDLSSTLPELPVVTLSTGPSSWGTGRWGSARWGGSTFPSLTTSNASGVGTNVALAVRGLATAKTVLVGLDVSFNVGGLL